MVRLEQDIIILDVYKSIRIMLSYFGYCRQWGGGISYFRLYDLIRSAPTMKSKQQWYVHWFS